MPKLHLVLLALTIALVTVIPLAGSATAAACGTPAKVTVSPRQVTATTTVAGTVRLTCKAGRAIRVALTGGAGLVVPPSVLVRKGKQTAGFRIRTLPSTVTRHPSITARANGLKRSVAVTVRTGCASRVAAFTVPAGLYAGETRAGSIRLGCAPRSAVAITFTSSDPAVTARTVLVPAGRTTASVPVSASLADGDRRTAVITARYAGASLVRSTTVTPGLAYAEIPASSAFNDVGLVIGLTGTTPSPGGVTVKLSSNNPAVTVPAAFTITQGQGAGVPGIAVTPVVVDTPITLSITLGNRTIKVGTTLLRPFHTGDQATVGTQAEGVIYGTRSYIQFDLNLSRPAPADGLEVTWAVRGDDPALTMSDWPTQMMSEGQRSTSINLSAADVTETTTVYIDVTIGTQTVSREVTIEPRLLSITAPATVSSGSPFSGTITTAGPSDTDQVVYLGASWAIVTPDNSVTIPAGETSVTYHATTVAVETEANVFLTADRGGNSVGTDAITLTPTGP